jgi:hypothetical protein
MTLDSLRVVNGLEIIESLPNSTSATTIFPGLSDTSWITPIVNDIQTKLSIKSLSSDKVICGSSMDVSSVAGRFISEICLQKLQS